MAKVLIVYATRSGQTQRIAENIADGLKSAGQEPTLKNVNSVSPSGNDLLNYDGYILGSATYHGEMLQSMKTLLFSLEKLNLANKVGASFGAFGWSGEAPGRIFDTMKNVYGMDMVSGPLKLRSAGTEDGAGQAREYGRMIGGKLAPQA